MNKIKNWWNSLWKFIFKHEATVYVGLGVSCLFLSYIFINNIKHTTELYKIKTEILLIERGSVEMEALSEDQFDLIGLQMETITKQRETLDRSKEVISMQENVIRQLIDYLKSIDKWPPPPPKPVDPSKWI